MLFPATGLNASCWEGEGLTTKGRPGEEERGGCRSCPQLVLTAVLLLFQDLEEYVFEFIRPRLQVSHNNIKG